MACTHNLTAIVVKRTEDKESLWLYCHYANRYSYMHSQYKHFPSHEALLKANHQQDNNESWFLFINTQGWMYFLGVCRLRNLKCPHHHHQRLCGPSHARRTKIYKPQGSGWRWVCDTASLWKMMYGRASVLVPSKCPEARQLVPLCEECP